MFHLLTKTITTRCVTYTFTFTFESVYIALFLRWIVICNNREMRKYKDEVVSTLIPVDEILFPNEIIFDFMQKSIFLEINCAHTCEIRIKLKNSIVWL